MAISHMYSTCIYMYVYSMWLYYQYVSLSFCTCALFSHIQCTCYRYVDLTSASLAHSPSYGLCYTKLHLLTVPSVM